MWIIDKCKVHTGGANWDTATIAVIDLSLCSIFADVSSAALASLHGLDVDLRVAESNREVILEYVPANAVLCTRTLKELIELDGTVVLGESNGYERWVQFAKWVHRSGGDEASPRPWWLPM